MRAAAAEARRQKVLSRGVDRLKRITQGPGMYQERSVAHEDGGAEAGAGHGLHDELAVPTLASSLAVQESSTSRSDPAVVKAASATAAPLTIERNTQMVSTVQTERRPAAKLAQPAPSLSSKPVDETSDGSAPRLGSPVSKSPLDSHNNAAWGCVKIRLCVAALAGLLWWLCISDSLQGPPQFQYQLQLVVKRLPMLPMLICAQLAILSIALVPARRLVLGTANYEGIDAVSTGSANSPGVLQMILSLAPPAVRSAVLVVATVSQWAQAVGQAMAVAVIVSASLQSNEEPILAMGTRLIQKMSSMYTKLTPTV